MPRHVGLALATLCLAALALPGVALGAHGAVPPGVSAAGQYTESLPGAGGAESTKSMVPNGTAEGGGTAAPAARALGAENAGRLEELGPEGRAAANLAAAGAGDGGGPTGKGGGDSGAGDATAGASIQPTSSSSGVGQVVDRLSGSDSSGGMGLLLPLLIAMAVVAAAGYLIGRRRLMTHDQP